MMIVGLLLLFCFLYSIAYVDALIDDFNFNENSPT